MTLIIGFIAPRFELRKLFLAGAGLIVFTGWCSAAETAGLTAGRLVTSGIHPAAIRHAPQEHEQPIRAALSSKPIVTGAFCGWTPAVAMEPFAFIQSMRPPTKHGPARLPAVTNLSTSQAAGVVDAI